VAHNHSLTHTHTHTYTHTYTHPHIPTPTPPHPHTHLPSYDSDAKPGDVVCYGQHITLTTLPNEGGQVNIHNWMYLH